MLDAVPGGPDRSVAELARGQRQAGADLPERAVADGVEAGLQPGARAGHDVVADGCRVQVAVPGVAGVGVRLAQVRGVRPDRAVGEEVAGGADRPELQGPGDALGAAPRPSR